MLIEQWVIMVPPDGFNLIEDLWRGGAGAHLADDILMTFICTIFVEQVHDAKLKGCALIFFHVFQNLEHVLNGG